MTAIQLNSESDSTAKRLMNMGTACITFKMYRAAEEQIIIYKHMQPVGTSRVRTRVPWMIHGIRNGINDNDRLIPLTFYHLSDICAR